MLVSKLLGRLISNKPKNHKAKTTNMIKKMILGNQWVATQLANSGPPNTDTSVPRSVKITIMHAP
jgi:hypothetical protein